MNSEKSFAMRLGLPSPCAVRPAPFKKTRLPIQFVIEPLELCRRLQISLEFAIEYKCYLVMGWRITFLLMKTPKFDAKITYEAILICFVLYG